MIPIFHRQCECIGCFSCVEIAPETFKINDEGLAELHHKLSEEAPYTISEAFNEDEAALKEAASACPVEIILLKRP